MPHRRQVQKGSFGSHFDELLVRFPTGDRQTPKHSAARSAKLQERIDVHRALFERAWQLPEDDR